MKKPPSNFTLSAEEGEALITRVHHSGLSAHDAGGVAHVIRMYCWVTCALQEAKLSVKRLRAVLCGKNPPTPHPAAPEESSPSPQTIGEEDGAGEVPSLDEAAAGATCDSQPGESSPTRLPTPPGGHRPGTGRLGAEASTGAERIECHHEDLVGGQVCPVCGQGRLYALPPGVERRIEGHALRSALRYALQKLRCSACGQMFTAPLPQEAGAEKYSTRARAVLVVGR